MSKRPFDPIIMIGMHRSGTTALTRALEGFGLFAGIAKDVNDEALYFQRLNVWMMESGSARWDVPEPFGELLANRRLRDLVTDYARVRVRGPATVGYLGLRRALGGTDLLRRTDPWGWKDPRNTFTLPIWLEIFPNAKVIHIYRHGIDVAASLMTRQAWLTEERAKRYRRRRWLHGIIEKKTYFCNSAGFGTLDRGVRLWDAYLTEARRHCAALGPRALELSYETFVADPEDGLARISAFSGLDVPRNRIALEASRLDAGRAFDYRRKPDFASAARGYAPLLAKHGFEA